MISLLLYFIYFLFFKISSSFYVNEAKMSVYPGEMDLKKYFLQVNHSERGNCYFHVMHGYNLATPGSCEIET